MKKINFEIREPHTFLLRNGAVSETNIFYVINY